MGSATRFVDDLDFLQRHTETVVLSDPRSAALVAVCPALQGRVATSTTGGEAGPSFGWLNRALIASGKGFPHMNAYGGEDRFWLGPEGGQFSLFFAPGAPQDLAHWQTPAPIDAEPFTLADRAENRVLLRKTMRLTNASGTVFDLEVEREVHLYTTERTWSEVGVGREDGRVKTVGFESRNRIINRGTAPWRRDTGLISIWIAGTFAPSPSTIVVLPFRAGAETQLGPIVNDQYFGQVPSDRLVVGENAIYFRGDGQQRGKIGVSPGRACPSLGSYDAQSADAGVLTLVTYTLPAGARDYVNSLWEHQREPYRGDAINSYNDGSPAPGAKALGPFYELESSSPALALAPGESAEHVHRTLHFVGKSVDLDAIARASLGVGIAEITSAFSSSFLGIA
ncbi:MAG TPA: DUF6786 family protein [Chloroflexota bacterium]